MRELWLVEGFDPKTGERFLYLGHSPQQAAAWSKEARLINCLSAAHRRRARLVGAQAGTDRKAYRRFLAAVRAADRLACYWCQQETPPKLRRIDHIFPIAKG